MRRRSDRLLPVVLALLAVAAQPFLAVSECGAGPEENDPFAPIRFLLGRWVGDGSGMGGPSTVQHVYAEAVQGNFIRLETFSVSAPGEEGKPGEIHQDIGYFSYDTDRGRLMLRQFLSEGYVNTYALADQDDGGGPGEPVRRMVFVTESAESAGGMRARLTYVIPSRDEMELTLALAPPGKEFFDCRHMSLRRQSP